VSSEARRPPVPTARVRGPRGLGRILRQYRRREGLSQQEVADRLGVSRVYVVKLESGETTLWEERLFGMLDVLGLDLWVGEK